MYQTIPPGERVVVSYQTAVFDFMVAAPVAYAFVMPSRPGYVFSWTSSNICHILTRNAALTNNMTWVVAQSGVAITATGNVTVASANTYAAPSRVVTTSGLVTQRVDGTLPLQALITVTPAGVGLTDFTGYFEIFGAWDRI